MAFYDNFIKLCNKANKSPSRVVLEAGGTKSAITRWKNGSMPTDATASKIADYFGVSVDSLLGDDQKEKTTTSESGGFSEKDVRLMAWFRSLPEEKRKAILSLGGAPEDLAE